ncbi:hypothetical protein AAZX31_13G148500 [Glycine max]
MSLVDIGDTDHKKKKKTNPAASFDKLYQRRERGLQCLCRATVVTSWRPHATGACTDDAKEACHPLRRCSSFHVVWSLEYLGFSNPVV